MIGSKSWDRWCIDVTHVNGFLYLTMIDTFTRFTSWIKLKSENGTEISHSLELLFSILGPPEHLLSDNAKAFHCREITSLCKAWDIKMEFSCAYRPQDNGCIERVHREVKRSSGRTGRSVYQSVFWYNNSKTPTRNVPYEEAFSAKSKKPGVKGYRENIHRNLVENSQQE